MSRRAQGLAAEDLTQTSVRFPKPLLKRARIRTKVDEISLQALLIQALETELDRRDKLDERRDRRRAQTMARAQ
jgi:hypothetical protein